MSERVEQLFDEIRVEPDIFKKARLIEQLHKEEDTPLNIIAESLQIKPSYVSHLLRLNRLPEIMVDGYYSGLVTMSHLFVLSRIQDSEQLMKAYEQVLAEGLSSAGTERIVREYLYGIKTDGDYIPMEEKSAFQTRAKKGRVQVRMDLVQTRIKSRADVELIGSLDDTAELLRSLMKKLDEWKREQGI